MPEDIGRRLSRLIARKRADAKAARAREAQQAQDAEDRDAIAANVAEKWDQDKRLIAEVAAYFEAELGQFGVKLAPEFRPGNDHTLVGTGTIKILGLDGRDRRITLTVHTQGAVHVSYETPPSKAILLRHKEFQISTATRATYEAEILDFLEFAL